MKNISFMKKEFSKPIFIFLISSSLLWILLMGLSIHYYPGGSFGDPTTEGFSFFYNAISDLGRFNATNGEPNTVSRVLSITAINIVSIATILYFGVIWKYFQDRKSTRWLSIIGSVSGVACSCCYIMLSYAAADTVFPFHKNLLTIFPTFFFITVVFYMIAFYMKKDFPRINADSYAVLIAAAIAFIIVLIVGFVQGDELDRIGRRAGNTLFNFVQIFVYSLQGIGAYIYIQRQNRKKVVEENAKE